MAIYGQVLLYIHPHFIRDRDLVCVFYHTLFILLVARRIFRKDINKGGL